MRPVMAGKPAAKQNFFSASRWWLTLRLTGLVRPKISSLGLPVSFVVLCMLFVSTMAWLKQ